MVSHELLVKYGFIKSGLEENYIYNEVLNEYRHKNGGINAKDADVEIEELPYVAHPPKGSYYRTTGFPKSLKRYRIHLEVPELNMEESYYWVHNYFVEDLGLPHIVKTEDVFSASENSAFFGVSQQRLGAQQDKISQYLATIGKMIKELFQLVRELRILDERIDYYNDAEAQLLKPISKREKNSEITLKGIFIDLVQGGSKNAASVFGMARELEFTSLPDLFFDAPPLSTDELEPYMETLKDFNRSVRRVLIRHLDQFIRWKERTSKEHITRKRFTLQYFRQHYEIIKMYMAWVRPYLRHVQRLTMKSGFESEPEIISAFETSMMDIELMGYRPWKEYNTVILATFNYRTKPGLKYQQEGYQRGPIHVGKVEMYFRGYVWTKKQIENYIRMKDAEDLELMRSVSGAVASAMEALGEEMKRYLAEAGRENGEETEPKEKPKEAMLRRMFHDFMPEKNPEKKEKVDKYVLDKEKSDVKGDMHERLFLLFKNFKKGHGMIMW